MGDQRFIVFSAGRDCRRYVGNHIDSIQRQNYPDFVHVVVDDVSTDGTYEKLKKSTHSRMALHRNERNKYWVWNAMEYLPGYIESDEDVIVIVDMDDWLLTKGALSILNSVYREKGCWMTYGSLVYKQPGRQNLSKVPTKYYSESVIKDRTFRKVPWTWWHPKTFKAFLWQAIKVEDLHAPNGRLPRFTYDKAIGFPMLEMTPPGKMVFVKDVLYVYNLENPRRSKKILKDHGGLGGWYREKKPYEVLKR